MLQVTSPIPSTRNSPNLPVDPLLDQVQKSMREMMPAQITISTSHEARLKEMTEEEQEDELFYQPTVAYILRQYTLLHAEAPASINLTAYSEQP